MVRSPNDQLTCCAGTSGGHLSAVPAALGQGLSAPPAGLDDRGECHRVGTAPPADGLLSLPVRGGGAAAEETEGRSTDLLCHGSGAACPPRLPLLTDRRPDDGDDVVEGGSGGEGWNVFSQMCLRGWVMLERSDRESERKGREVY